MTLQQKVYTHQFRIKSNHKFMSNFKGTPDESIKLNVRSNPNVM